MRSLWAQLIIELRERRGFFAGLRDTDEHIARQVVAGATCDAIVIKHTLKQFSRHCARRKAMQSGNGFVAQQSHFIPHPVLFFQSVNISSSNRTSVMPRSALAIFSSR